MVKTIIVIQKMINAIVQVWRSQHAYGPATSWVPCIKAPHNVNSWPNTSVLQRRATNLNNEIELVHNSTRSFDESAYPSTTTLPSSFSSSVFAAGAVDEPGIEGRVGIVPSTFFIFLRGADLVYCGAGRTQPQVKQTMRFLERVRSATASLH